MCKTNRTSKTCLGGNFDYYRKDSKTRNFKEAPPRSHLAAAVFTISTPFPTVEQSKGANFASVSPRNARTERSPPTQTCPSNLSVAMNVSESLIASTSNKFRWRKITNPCGCTVNCVPNNFHPKMRSPFKAFNHRYLRLIHTCRLSQSYRSSSPLGASPFLSLTWTVDSRLCQSRLVSSKFLFFSSNYLQYLQNVGWKLSFFQGACSFDVWWNVQASFHMFQWNFLVLEYGTLKMAGSKVVCCTELESHRLSTMRSVIGSGDFWFCTYISSAFWVLNFQSALL